MLEKPLITRTTTQALAALHQTVPRAEIRNVMGPGVADGRSAAAALGVGVTGPCLTNHLLMDPDVFDFEICVPVASPIPARGREKPGLWPAGCTSGRVNCRPPHRLTAPRANPWWTCCACTLASRPSGISRCLLAVSLGAASAGRWSCGTTTTGRAWTS